MWKEDRPHTIRRNDDLEMCFPTQIPQSPTVENIRQLSGIKKILKIYFIQQEEKTKGAKFVTYHVNLSIFVIKTEFFFFKYALGHKVTVLATLS